VNSKTSLTWKVDDGFGALEDIELCEIHAFATSTPVGHLVRPQWSFREIFGRFPPKTVIVKPSKPMVPCGRIGVDERFLKGLDPKA